jgi:anti-sigma factor RsiW
VTHLTIDQLVALREPGAEPGTQAARDHLDACDACRAEFDRLHQRIARLKALPALRPTRDRWPAVRARFEAERRARRLRRFGLVGLAAAAAVALVVGTRSPSRTLAPATTAELSDAMARSRALEAAIDRYHPETRVLDGRTARIAQELEDRIAAVDRQLEMTDLQNGGSREAQELDLWRERVGLLDALVDVHLTRASNVGL